jgi:hypothetical protein
VNDVENVISHLEKQRSAIDRALSALREISGSSASGSDHTTRTRSQKKKRHLSPEGRRRIIEATKKRWATVRANAANGRESAAAPTRARRGKLSAAGRKRLALAMKKRWAAAKKAGRQRLT